MTLARGEREWALLVSEYNICKKKLESKRQALKILMGDLESCQRERDIYKNKIKQMQHEIENYKKKELENDHKEAKGRRSPTSPSVRSPEHTRPKRVERKFSGQSIWEQELQSVRDRKNKTLSQLLCESREENKALKNDFMDLRVLYREAQEDIILLRENVSRQRTNEKGCKMEDLEVRQELIQRLEKNQEKIEELEREVQASNDEKSEIVIERDHYRDKVERLNTQLNFILGADERRLVDIDAILMENRYQKEQIKQLKEEMRIASASLARQKAAIEKKKARLVKAGYHTGPATFGGGPAAVKQTLPSLIADISSSFNHGVSSSTVNDLQSLANSLSESLSEKDIALLHQRNTNKILGQRVAELEKKLKTLEVSGLWSLEGHHGYGSEELLQLYLEKLKRSSSMSHDESCDAIKVPDHDSELPSAESSPNLQNGESVFFDNDIPDTDQELIDVGTSSFTPTISDEEEDNHSENIDTFNIDLSSCSRATNDLEQQGNEGQFYNRRDSPEHKEHDIEGDSPLNKSDKEESCGEEDFSLDEESHTSSTSQLEGDSHAISISQIDGDSLETSKSQINGDSHATSTSPIDKDLSVKGNSFSAQLNDCSAKTSEIPDLKENTLANTATNSIKQVTDNSAIACGDNSKPCNQSGEQRSNTTDEYGLLEEQSYGIKMNSSEDINDDHGKQTVRNHHGLLQGNVSVTECVSEYYEPDCSSLDDVEDQAH